MKHSRLLIISLFIGIISSLSSCSFYCEKINPNQTACRFYNVKSDIKKISNLPSYDWKFKRISSSKPVLNWHLENREATVTISNELIKQTKNNDELTLLLTQAMAHLSLRHPNSVDFTTYDDLKVREADRLGMAYASRVVYDPRPAKAMWMRLADKYHGSPYVGFSWNEGREETYTWNIEPIMRLYNGRKNLTVH